MRQKVEKGSSRLELFEGVGSSARLAVQSWAMISSLGGLKGMVFKRHGLRPKVFSKRDPNNSGIPLASAVAGKAALEKMLALIIPAGGCAC